MRVGINEPKDAPWQPVLHFMGALTHHLALGIDQQTDMAGGTRWRGEILADAPGYILEIPFRLFGGKDVAMLARFVNLVRRGIRPHMAFLAGIRFARHLDGEIMPGDGRRCSAPSLIQINAADTLVGPPEMIGNSISPISVSRDLVPVTWSLVPWQ